MPAASVPSPRIERLHFGVQLGTTGVTWSELQRGARDVEELGYESVWVPDHLVAREGATVPRLEAWQALAALAAHTTTIRLGPLVSPVTFRHPVLLAKMATTLDHISGGRVILGLGAGGMIEEHRQLGLPLGTPRGRGRRLEEAAQIVRSLLDEPTTTFEGTYYQLQDVSALPKPVQGHLPLLVAGAGSGAMRAAARVGNIWNAIGLPAAFVERVVALRSHLRACAREPSELLVTASFRLLIREDEAATDKRLSELDPMWRDDPYRIVGRCSEVVQEVQAYLEAGVRGFIVQMPAPFDFYTLERFAGEVRAALANR